MEYVEGPFGLRFVKVDSCEVYLGENRGAWVYASERPRHRVMLPSFLILESPITVSQYSEILGLKIKGDGLKDMITNEEIDHFCSALESHFEEDVRRPTQSEWEAAKGDLKLPCGWTELLADEATGNHRGARLDGRPRIGDMIGPLSGHRVSQSAHPTREGVFACVTTPGDRPLPKVGFRIVVSPKREGPVPKVPDNANLVSNIKSEIFWTSILGIIPSFTIPILRGFSSYALDGWANLLFGGLCAGFVTGAFWRPKRPTWGLDPEGNIIQLKD